MNARIQTTMTSTHNEHVSWSAAVNRLKSEERPYSVLIPLEITNKNDRVNNRRRSIHFDNIKTGHLNEASNLKRDIKTKSTIYYDTLSQPNSPYIRYNVKANLDQLCLVLLGEWGMYIPKLILRIVSDPNMSLNIKLERELLKGISDVAVASDACIVTSCYKEDTVSQLIGEVIYKSRIKNREINFRAIGVGKLDNIRDCSINKEREDSNSTGHYAHRFGNKTLERKLTHYVFFDDGTYESMDTGQFASALAEQISIGSRRRIPLVTTLVGGDLHALQLIYDSLKNKFPIVIVDQSGPLANIMCKHLKLTENLFKSMKNRNQELINNDESDVKDNDDEIIADMLQQRFDQTTLGEVLINFGNLRWQIFKDLRKLYGFIRQQDYAIIGRKMPINELLNIGEEVTLARYVFWFATCLLPPFREQIHIYDFKSSNSFQNKIYEALIQARENLSKTTSNKRSMTVDDQINLALRWNITDMTKDNLMSNTTDWKDTKKIKQNLKLILDALSKNSHVFISNFFKFGIDFIFLFSSTIDPTNEKETLPWGRYLETLYSDAMRKNIDPLYLLDEIDKRLSFKKQTDLDRVLEILVGDFMKPISHFQWSCRKNQGVPELTQDKTMDEYIYRDLFLWCVLTHRLEMAKIFLRQMKTRICSALIASKILKSLAEYAPDHDSNDRIHLEADDFETYAIECIRCSYFYDREQVCELIIRRVDLYGEVTCLQMAIAADDKKFLYEDACNALLTKIWYDKNDPAQERTRLVINLLTMGIAQFFISAYHEHYDKEYFKRSEAYTNTETSMQRPLAKHGINYTDDYQSDELVYKHFLHFHNRPIVKFYYTCFSYVLFLLFFSYFMLYAFNPRSDTIPDIHWTEILTIIFVTTMLFEEVRQFYFQDYSHLKSKILTYFDWKNRSSNLCLVLPSYLLFYAGLILRFVITDPDQFVAARIVMAYDLELWFIRSALFIGIAPKLGPRLVMIRKMTNDLLFFVFLITIAMFGYGIASRSMTAYGTIAFDGRAFFLKVISPVYYFVLGDFDGELSNLEAKSDAGTSIATLVLFSFHMLFVNILLLNLLISLFTTTIGKVEEKANYIWAYDRCELIRDYYARPALFPPFTFLISIFDFCRWCWKKCRHNNTDARCFKMIPCDGSVDNGWSEFERYSTNDYVRRLLDIQAAEAPDTDITSEVLLASDNELKLQNSEFNRLNDGLTRTRTETGDRLLSMEVNVSTLHDHVKQIDNRLDEVVNALNWMMSEMVSAKMTNMDPPLIKPKPGVSVSCREQRESNDNAQNNRQLNKQSSLQLSQQPKQMITTASNIPIVMQNKPNDEKKDSRTDSF